jgi:hypothetical protein
MFFRAKDRNKLTRITVDMRYSYLTREHQRTTTIMRRNIGELSDSLKVVVLGIILLEIYYRLPIEKLLRPENLGLNNCTTEISYLQAACC